MKLYEIGERNKANVAGALRVPFTENEACHWYIIECLVRFYGHDYGEIPPEDVEANEAELKTGEGRIVARYKAANGLTEDIFIIAYFSDSHAGEVDYNYTTVLYVSDY